jgi:hypothetical protein
VAAAFNELGRKIKDHYQTSGEAGPDDEEVKEAFKTIAGAWDRVVESIGSAFRDPELKAQVRSTGSAIAKAVGTAFNDAGKEIRKAVDRTDKAVDEAVDSAREELPPDPFDPAPFDGSEEGPAA